VSSDSGAAASASSETSDDSMSSPKKKKKRNDEQQTRSPKKKKTTDGRWSPSIELEVYDVSEVDGSDEEGAGEADWSTSTRSQYRR
jgi:hypothetical protein